MEFANEAAAKCHYERVKMNLLFGVSDGFSR